MSKVKILVEVMRSVPEAFTRFHAAMDNPSEGVRQSESLLEKLGGMGLEPAGDVRPIPLFGGIRPRRMAALSAQDEGQEPSAESSVIACEIPLGKLSDLKAQQNIKVWPNSTMSSFGRRKSSAGDCPHCGDRSARARNFATKGIDTSGMDPFDLARSASSHVDCSPYRPAATQDDIRRLLAVQRIWDDGYRGQNIVVAVVDDGIHDFYPVIGGHERPGGPRPGTADIDSHGSMCAADILVAAPFARLLDYPFLAGPDGGDSNLAIEMFHEILDRRRRDGTPHLTSNSYGFTDLPTRSAMPDHEAYNPNHPLNRKVREVIASGCACFFAAGNCGANCPDGRCRTRAIGPGKSISAAGSLPECVAVAAVNSRHERIGYSAQGPGTLYPSRNDKPNLAAYSHFYGNFGPGRPAGGGIDDYDSGTSAACPVAAGVGALLLSAFPDLAPARLSEALTATAINLNQPGWDAETGHGVLNAGAAYNRLRAAAVSPTSTGVETGGNAHEVARDVQE